MILVHMGLAARWGCAFLGRFKVAPCFGVCDFFGKDLLSLGWYTVSGVCLEGEGQGYAMCAVERFAAI